RPPRPPLRARVGRPLRRPARDRVQGVQVGARGRRRDPRPQRRPPRAAALGARPPDLAGPGAGGERAGLGVPRGRRMVLPAEELTELNQRLGAEEGDLLLLVADKPAVTNTVLGQMRLDLAERFDLIDPEDHRLVWIVDWPLFDWNED